MTFASKTEALDAMEISREDWLAEARDVALRLAQGGARVTVDDVRREAPPLPAEADPRVYGAIFRGPDWHNVGYRKSARRTCHNRPIGVFVLAAHAGEAS